MLDNERATIGGNNPPAYDMEAHAEWSAKVEDFLKASRAWLSMESIETEEHAGQLTDQIDGLRGLWKKVDASRKEQKKPHDEAGAAVQAAYNPLLKRLTTAADKLKPKLAAYASKKREEDERRQKAEQEAAAKEAAEAEEALQKAEASGDIGSLVDAEEKAEAAKAAQKSAARKTSSGVKSASGAGRTMSLRKVKEVEIVNAVQLFLALRDEPEVIEALQRAATRLVRAKGYDESTPLPGIKVTEKDTVA